MASLLNNATHITNNLKTDAIEVHHSFKLPDPHPSIIPFIEKSGFGDFVRIGSFKIIPSLITALVERWRPETHTFHLPVGECTITLQDVSLHLGLPVNGNAVTGSCEYNWDDVCLKLLGRSIPPNGMVGNQVKFTWLNSWIFNVPVGASNKILRQHARGYLMMVIGGAILPDKSSNRVNIKYLPLLSNFENIGKYSWGSACLTNLYRMLCKTATCTSSCMGGCTMLLQSWAWYRINSIAPSCAKPYDWPLAKR